MSPTYMIENRTLLSTVYCNIIIIHINAFKESTMQSDKKALHAYSAYIRIISIQMDNAAFTDVYIDRIANLSNDLLSTCENIQRLNEYMVKNTTIEPTTLKLSTMTIFSRLDVPDGFLLNKVIEYYLENGNDKFREIMGLDVHIVFPIRKTKKTSRGKNISNFFNQLTFWYKDCTKKSVKLFINGNVHVTGCRSLEEYSKLMKHVCGFMDYLFPESPKKCRVQDIDIQMVNTNFSVGRGLDLSRLKRILLDQGMCATYDREVYPGLNLKVPTSANREASVLVFISGNIIITGVRHFYEVYEAYKFITESICNTAHMITKKRITVATVEKKKPSAVAIADGYESHIIESILCSERLFGRPLLASA